MKAILRVLLIGFLYILPLSMAMAEGEKEVVLNNGMRVFIKPMRLSPIVTVNFWIKNGSIYEKPEESGYSELVSKLLFKSSFNFPNGGIEKELNRLGVKYSINTSNDCQSFSLTGPSKHFYKIFELGINGLFYSTFSDEDLLNAITAVNKSIETTLSRPDSVVFNALVETIFTNHPCKRPYYGNIANINNVNSALLNAFYKKNYLPSNSILIITGDVEANSALNLVKQHLDSIKSTAFEEPKFASEPNQKEYREKIVYADLEKVYVNFGWKVPGLDSVDKYALFVLAKLIGGSEDSYLWNKLVKGHETCEYISAFYGAARFESIFQIAAVTSHSKAKHLINDVRSIAKNLMNEDFSDELLKEVKSSIITEDAFNCESVENAAYNYGSFAIMGKATDADEFAHGILSVTREDLMRVITEFLLDEKLNVAILKAPPISDNSMPLMLTLDNGIKLILKENHATPVIAVSCKFAAGGYREEKKQGGLSSLACEMLCRSTDLKGVPYMSRLEKLGAKLSYSSCKSYVSVDMKVVSSSFYSSFETFMEMLGKPEFSNDLTKPKETLEKMLAYESTDIGIQNEFNVVNSLYTNSVLTYSNYGKLADISKIRKYEVIDYYRKHFIPGNLVIAIVGDFYATEVKEYILSTLGKYSAENSAKPRKLQASEAAKIKSDSPIMTQIDGDMAQITYISKSVDSSNKSELALTLASKILEDNLKESFKKSDSTGLMSSSLKVANKSYLSDGYFIASVKTHKDNIATATRLLKLEIEAFKIGIVNKESLNRAKEKLLTNRIMTLTDNQALARLYSRDEIMGQGFDYYSKYEDALNAITSEEIKNVATSYMLPEKEYLIGISSSNIDDFEFKEGKFLAK